MLLALAAVYGMEDLSVRYYVPRGRQVMGAVTVKRYDAIPKKNGKVEFAFEEPVSENCIYAAFPHMGYAPCWYLRRHSEQRISY
jgi:hypothetical protein